MLRLFGFAVLLAWVGCLAIALDLSPATEPWPSPRADDKVKIGYWPSYAYDQFPATAINATLFTHLSFAFAGVNSSTFKLEIPKETIGSARTFSMYVKRQNPYVKTLLSIGGAGANTTVFSEMARRQDSRLAFITSSILLARNYRFDGLDIDWEFPNSEEDLQNLGLLFSEMRFAVDAEARIHSTNALLLTAAVYYAALVTASTQSGAPKTYTYPIDVISANLDWVHIMCYDYHGSWDNTTTGEHTALNDKASNFSSSYGIRTWLEGGLPPEKAVMGLAMYGRSWLLEDLSITGVGAAAKAPGPAQESSATPGVFFYFEIDEFVRKNNAIVVDDAETGSAYCYAGEVWIGYDNVVSIEKKVEFLLSRRMRGYFFWTASFDSKDTLSLTASQTLDNGGAAISPMSDGKSSSAVGLRKKLASLCALYTALSLIHYVLH